MFGPHYYMTPVQALTEVQDAFTLTDIDMAARIGVESWELDSWRKGTSRPPRAVAKRLTDMLALAEAERNARSGKFRQA